MDPGLVFSSTVLGGTEQLAYQFTCVLYTPLDTKLSLYREYTISLVRYIIFSQIDWTILFLFVQQSNKEKETRNFAIAQNGYARITLRRKLKYHAIIARNIHNRDNFHSLFCFKLHFIFLTFKHIFP
jgi:hypothetical protein